MIKQLNNLQTSIRDQILFGKTIPLVSFLIKVIWKIIILNQLLVRHCMVWVQLNLRILSSNSNLRVNILLTQSIWTLNCNSISEDFKIRSNQALGNHIKTLLRLLSYSHQTQKKCHKMEKNLEK